MHILDKRQDFTCVAICRSRYEITTRACFVVHFNFNIYNVIDNPAECCTTMLHRICVSRWKLTGLYKSFCHRLGNFAAANETDLPDFIHFAYKLNRSKLNFTKLHSHRSLLNNKKATKHSTRPNKSLNYRVHSAQSSTGICVCVPIYSVRYRASESIEIKQRERHKLNWLKFQKLVQLLLLLPLCSDIFFIFRLCVIFKLIYTHLYVVKASCAQRMSIPVCGQPQSFECV